MKSSVKLLKKTLSLDEAKRTSTRLELPKFETEPSFKKFSQIALHPMHITYSLQTYQSLTRMFSDYCKMRMFRTRVYQDTYLSLLTYSEHIQTKTETTVMQKSMSSIQPIWGSQSLQKT